MLAAHLLGAWAQHKSSVHHHWTDEACYAARWPALSVLHTSHTCPSWHSPMPWLRPCPGCAVLHQIFPEQLKASKYVTTDPEEADYFFADGEGSQQAVAEFIIQG